MYWKSYRLVSVEIKDVIIILLSGLGFEFELDCFYPAVYL